MGLHGVAKVSCVLLGVVSAGLLVADGPEARAKIRITKIDLDGGFINGMVWGLPEDKVGDYVVLVYVKTDYWYIHPDHNSAAGIGPNGSWECRHVRHEGDEPSWIAALVMQEGDPRRRRVQFLDAMKPVAKWRMSYRKNYIRNVPPRPQDAKQPAVRITLIDAAKELVRGVVKGVRPDQLPDLVVALYVETDKWYVHPYRGMVSEMDDDGSWESEHVWRGDETQIAALLVRRTAQLPHEAKDLPKSVASKQMPYPKGGKFQAEGEVRK